MNFSSFIFLDNPNNPLLETTPGFDLTSLTKSFAAFIEEVIEFTSSSIGSLFLE